jgi:hypothetical protein
MPGIVPHPVDRETIPSEPIDASERRIELPPIIGSPADAVALHEAVTTRPPFAANVDRIVESIAGFDLREKTRFQDLRDERLTAIDDAPLFQRVDLRRPSRFSAEHPNPLGDHWLSAHSPNRNGRSVDIMG